MLPLVALMLLGPGAVTGEEGVSRDGPRVLALRLARVDGRSGYTEEGVILLTSGQEARLEVVGAELVGGASVKLTTARLEAGQDCRTGSNGSHPVLTTATLELGEDGVVTIQGSDIVYSSSQDNYYVCLSVGDKSIHQGTHHAVTIQLAGPILWPVWVNFIILAFLLVLSGLFSGLNLGLMSLDQTELQIVIKTGSEAEQENAKAIYPVRNLGNFLLCSLLFGNVLVNVLIPMLMDSIPGANGILAVIGSTFGIVIFGEIIPQAICSRHGLAVGAKTIGITKFFMLLTAPLSWPISKLLDLVLGEELGTVYNRARLIELLRVTQANMDLNKDEVNILQGALVLQEKKIEDIMTPLGDCYMLPLEAVLDFDTISEIKDKGYSRIPVYDEEETNVVHILLAKDLLFIDPDDKKPLAEVCGFYKTQFITAEKDRPLNKMLDEFKTGEKGHLAIVKGEEDVGAIGLVSLEDIIEEIIQAEIVDETDIVMDNKTKKKRRKTKRQSREKEVRMFMEPQCTQVEVSPQVSHAVLQFLTSSLPPFAADIINTDILKKLLMLDVFRMAKSSSESRMTIVEQGRPCDFFILIVEGKVDVHFGSEGHVFESGPFTSFGKQLLVPGPEGGASPRPQPWTPDVTLVPRGEVLYLKVRLGTWRQAVLASRSSGEESSQHLQGMVEAQHSPTHEHETTPLLGEIKRNTTINSSVL